VYWLLFSYLETSNQRKSKHAMEACCAAHMYTVYRPTQSDNERCVPIKSKTIQIYNSNNCIQLRLKHQQLTDDRKHTAMPAPWECSSALRRLGNILGGTHSQKPGRLSYDGAWKAYLDFSEDAVMQLRRRWALQTAGAQISQDTNENCAFYLDACYRQIESCRREQRPTPGIYVPKLGAERNRYETTNTW